MMLYMPSLIEFDLLVLEKKMKMLKSLQQQQKNFDQKSSLKHLAQVS